MEMANPVDLPEFRIEPTLGGMESQPGRISIGDLVQWTSGGVDQFETPRRVRAIKRHDGEEWAFVEGTRTGVPMSELTVVTPKPAAITRPSPGAAAGAPMAGEREVLRGALSREASYRLLVSGDVGPRELGRIIRLLEAQKAILEDDTDQDSRSEL
jgi:hypothetical protein